jgi:DNA (cytosine-5)-methyltransferase 1
MRLTTFSKLSENRESPRLWVESNRLARLGFAPGTPLAIAQAPNRLTITPALLETGNTVSSRRDAGGQRPIIDINNRTILMPLVDFSEIKLVCSSGRIEVTPSIRGFTIAKRKQVRRLEAIEFFAGGGLMSQAIEQAFTVKAGVEIEPAYADVWAAHHSDADLIQASIRDIHPAELPTFDILVAGIPCTSHSNMGRAKKNLAGCPELGDTGDLYISVLNVIAYHLPLACVFENVPNYGASLAGETLKAHLQKIGYHITETILDPLNEWGEPQDRKRWCCIATLEPGFELKSPGIQFDGNISQFIDGPDSRDLEDCQRIATTIEGLRRHNARHQAMGHGFGFTTINQKSTKIPTLVKSYHKINTGPFVETQHGLRMLRKSEMERIMGASIECDHYSTAVQILGQGVQTRVFAQVMKQLKAFLTK